MDIDAALDRETVLVREYRLAIPGSLRLANVRPRSAAALLPADEEPAAHVVERLRRLARRMLPSPA